MKKFYVVQLLFVLIGLLTLSGLSHAADQSNFSISPPPIASPEFEAGKSDKKLTATYIGISGSGIDFTGGGANFITRKAVNNKLAFDGSFGMYVFGGKINVGSFKADMSTINLPLSGNIEFQPVNTQRVSLILFAGPIVAIAQSHLTYTTKYPFCSQYTTISGVRFCSRTTDVDNLNTIDSTMMLYGLQGGAQVGLTLGDFKISPFLMFMSQSGNVDSSTSSTFGSSSSASTTIPSFTTTSYGLDIVYVPWSLTLSSVLQEAAKSGDNSGFKTTIYSLSWNF